MRLLNVFAFHAPAADIILRVFGKIRMRGQGIHPLFNHLDEFVVVYAPDCGCYHIVCGIVRTHVIEHAFFVKTAHMFGCSQNSASRCLIRKCRFLKVIEYQIVRCVCGLFDFLYHDFFFFAHLRRVKRRVGDKVADNVGCKFQVVLEHFGIKTGEMP